MRPQILFHLWVGLWLLATSQFTEGLQSRERRDETSKVQQVPGVQQDHSVPLKATWEMPEAPVTWVSQCSESSPCYLPGGRQQPSCTLGRGTVLGLGDLLLLSVGSVCSWDLSLPC